MGPRPCRPRRRPPQPPRRPPRLQPRASSRRPRRKPRPLSRPRTRPRRRALRRRLPREATPSPRIICTRCGTCKCRPSCATCPPHSPCRPPRGCRKTSSTWYVLSSSGRRFLPSLLLSNPFQSAPSNSKACDAGAKARANVNLKERVRISHKSRA